MTIEFNKHHYSDLWEKREYYRKVLGTPNEPYDFYLNMIGHTIAPFLTQQFPCSIATKQELIKIIMLAQADAVSNKLDVSSLKKPKPKRSLFKRLFKRGKDGNANENKAPVKYVNQK